MKTKNLVKHITASNNILRAVTTMSTESFPNIPGSKPVIPAPQFFAFKRHYSIPSPHQQQRRFFTKIATKSELQIIDEVFSSITIPPNLVTRIRLVKRLFTIEYNKYLDNQKSITENSHLFHLIDSLPAHLSRNEKIDLLNQLFLRYPVMPVITAHPTRAMSNTALFLMHETIELLAKLDAHTYETVQKKVLFEQVRNKLTQLVSQSLLPTENFTPEQEAQATLYVYKRMIKTFPDFYASVVERFVQAHGGDPKDIAARLKGALMEAYRHIYDWNYGDTDGNLKKIAATMKQIITDQQRALLELYISEWGEILALPHASNLEAVAILTSIRNKLADDLQNHQTLSIEECEQKKAALLEDLDQVLTTLSDHSLLYKKITELRHLIELGGFYGNLIAFVRQTTQMHATVWNNLTEILLKHCPEIQNTMRGPDGKIRQYEELTREEQASLYNIITQNRKYFEVLHQNAAEFNQLTRDELGRMALIRKNPKIFSTYIFSDTQHADNFNMAALLMHFSLFHLEGILDWSKIRSIPINVMPLPETIKDLHNSEAILEDMFENEHMRQRMLESQLLFWLFGPSDTSKTAGIVVYGVLLRKQLLCQTTLNRYAKIYPELKDVIFRWKHGYGPDWSRQNGHPKRLRHTTHQGWGAINELASPLAFPSLLHGMLGMRCASEYNLEEIEDLQKNHPQAYEAWLLIEDYAMDHFQDFSSQESIQDLLADTTVSDIEDKKNASSRKGSKKSRKPHEARAIGVVNHHMIANEYWNVYMSIIGLMNLPKELQPYLPILMDRLTVWKDIVYKIFYSIALSNNEHHWRRFTGSVPSPENRAQWSAEYRFHGKNERHQTLAYLDTNKEKALEILVRFFPDAQQETACLHLQQHKAKVLPYQLALSTMDVLGGDLSSLAQDVRDGAEDFREYNAHVEEYRSNPCPETLEYAVTAGRVIQLANTPRTLANLMSPRHKYAYEHPFMLADDTDPSLEETRIGRKC